MRNEEPGPRERGRQGEIDLPRREAEAKHHRQRLALYRARVLTGRPSSLSRLEELRRTSVAADARLAHAKASRYRPGSSGPV